jgi:hypothetical protein
MAVTQMLDSGTLDERSSQLLEQLAGHIRCPPTETAHRPESNSEAMQQPAPPREGQTETKSSGEARVETNPDGISEDPVEERVIDGSLRTTPEDRWTCKVPSCTRKFHRLKDCRFFHSMEPEDRIKLVEHHGLCLGCLTPGHGRAARSCPYEEERAEACQRAACRGRHHYLLHVEKSKSKEEPEGEFPGATAQYARGSDTNGGSRMRGAAGRPVGHHQGRRAILGILGHRVPGDACHAEDGPRLRPEGHPQLASEVVRHWGRPPPKGGDPLQGAAGRHRRESDHRDCLQSGQHHVSIGRSGHHTDEGSIPRGARRWLGVDIGGSEPAHRQGQPQPVSN